MNSEECGKFIQSLRKEKNWTQNELAELLQVSNKAVSRWETGEGYPDVSLLGRLAEVFTITVDELLKGARKPKTGNLPGVEMRWKLKSVSDAGLLISIGGFILFVVLMFATANVWIGMVGFVVPATAVLVWGQTARSRFKAVCVYDEADRFLLFSSMRNLYSLLIVLTCMLLGALLTTYDYVEVTFSEIWLAMMITGFFGTLFTHFLFAILSRRTGVANASWSSVTTWSLYGLVLLAFLTSADVLDDLYFLNAGFPSVLASVALVFVSVDRGVKRQIGVGQTVLRCVLAVGVFIAVGSVVTPPVENVDPGYRAFLTILTIALTGLAASALAIHLVKRFRSRSDGWSLWAKDILLYACANLAAMSSGWIEDISSRKGFIITVLCVLPLFWRLTSTRRVKIPALAKEPGA